MNPRMRLLTFFFTFCLASICHAETSASSHLKETGRSTLTWFGIDIYTAQLTMASSESRLDINTPITLTLTYHRKIPANRIVTQIKKEWLHLEFSRSMIKPWLAMLELSIPNIDKQDTLAFTIDDRGKSWFIYNGDPKYFSDNPQINQAILDIWLSPKTSRPLLRKSLLGLDHE